MPTADELLSSRDVLDLARVLAEQSPRGTRWPTLRDARGADLAGVGGLDGLAPHRRGCHSCR